MFARPSRGPGARLAQAAAALAVAAFVSLAAVPPASARGPESLADLAEGLVDAVVNISTTQSVGQARNNAGPQVPPGSPFEEFFDDFFNRQGRSGDRPRRVNSLGSGFVIDPSGIVVTNNHVISDADEIVVSLTDGTKLKAEVVGRDAKTDLAVLKVNPSTRLKAVKFGDSRRMRIGDWVLAIGNPFGLSGSVSAGIVSAVNRELRESREHNDAAYIQTDAAINRGNSGGPLFNMDGDVIGINTAIYSPSHSGGSVGVGFALPSAVAEPVIAQLREFGEVRRGWLGVRVQSVTDEIAQSLGLDKARGAFVAGISAKSPAAEAGLKNGDIILRFDGQDVQQMRSLPRLAAAAPIGKEVEITVWRDGREQTLRVRMGQLPDEGKQQQAALTPEEPKHVEPRPKALGLELAPITPELRREFNLAGDLKGVLVTHVDDGSPAAEKRLVPGDVILEVTQEPVASPEDMQKRIEALRKDGRPSALLLVANPQGELRFVALPLKSGG